MNRFFRRFDRFVFLIALTGALCGFRFYDKEYESIREMVARIVEMSPISNSYYIGVGRSPTPLVAFMESIGIKNVRQLPLSQMMSYAQMKSRPGVEDLMTEHLRSHLPSAQELNGKKVVLIDFSNHGNSIIASAKVIREFYGPAVSVDAIAIMKEENGTTLQDLMKHSKVKTLTLSEENILFKALLAQRYDEVSAVQQKWVWNTWSKMDPINEAEVQDFRKKLQDRIDQDPHARKITSRFWNRCMRLLLF